MAGATEASSSQVGGLPATVRAEQVDHGGNNRLGGLLGDRLGSKGSCRLSHKEVFDVKLAGSKDRIEA